MLPYKFAYIFGDLVIIFPVWLLLFIRRTDLRKEILTLSLLGGLAGPLSELWYLRDYWKPETITGWAIGIEDFLFGFLIAGIAVSVYEEVFGKHFSKRRLKTKHPVITAISFVVLFIAVFNFLIFGLNINSIYASSVGFIILALIIILTRNDLLEASLFSGLLVGTFMFCCYLLLFIQFPQLIQRWWYLDNISGVTLKGVPIEELFWAFGCGLVIGPAYEFFAGLRFKKISKRV